MADWERIVDEASADGAVTLAAKSQQRRSAGENQSAAYLAMSFHSRS
jgi:hypothetical protein